MGFFISRQRSSGDDSLYVEIAIGKALAGKDILPKRYENEHKNMLSPLDAIKFASKILAAWDDEYMSELKMIRIAVSSDEWLIFDNTRTGMDELMMWGNQMLKTLPRCCTCPKILSSKKEPFTHPELLDQSFCSIECAKTAYQKEFQKEPSIPPSRLSLDVQNYCMY